jgi:hypothetical protein
MICLLPLLFPTAALAQEGAGAGADTARTLEFSGRTWTVLAGDVKLESHLGKEAALFRDGAIALRDLDFENGTIEFDVATTGQRSFIGVAFRIEERGEYEHFYLRPHNSGRFDAMQYTPVFNGVSAWQLYPEYNASIEIPYDQWLHVRMVVSGSNLKVYFGEAAEPTLDVDRLRHGRAHGAVAILANFPAAEEHENLYPTAFADFEVHPDESPAAYEDVFTPAPERFIRRWAVSTAIQAPEGPVTELPADLMEDREGWTIALAEASGLVNLARYRAIPEGADRGMILARIVIRSDSAQVKKLNFGFSDQGSIFLNGRILFSANNTYRSRSQRYLGVVTVDNDAIYLPLQEGENELVIAVSESFGGWGLIGRFADLDRITVETEPQ